MRELMDRQVSAREQLYESFIKWLHIDDWQAVEIVIATVLSIFSPGDPVWLFLVKPSGGMGTELLRTFTGDYIHPQSSLTAHTLHSGKPGVEGLLYRLDSKVLIIKDFTAILQLRDADKNQIFADLRDAYDGYSDKAFGSGVKESSPIARFGIIAAVTPVIDMHRVTQSVLGERFLKVRMYVDERKAVRKAKEMAAKEQEMRNELRQAVSTYIDYYQHQLPTVEASQGEVAERIEDLSILLARLRSGVLRDRDHIVQYQPSPEVGTRLVKQLEKLAQSLSCLYGKEQPDEEVYRCLVRIARDSVDAQRWKLIGALAEGGCSVTTKELADRAIMPIKTAREHLENAMLLNIVGREVNGDEYHWSITSEVSELLASTRFISHARKTSGNSIEIKA